MLVLSLHPYYLDDTLTIACAPEVHTAKEGETLATREPASLFSFKVWVERDASGSFAAYCLETGAVATADDLESVQSLIDEVISSEAERALQTGNFANLYASPAPADVWFKWNEMATKRAPETRFLNIKAEEAPINLVPGAPKKPVASTRIEQMAKSA